MSMAPTAKFDASEGHKYFAAHCFNRAWDLIEKLNRTPEDDRLMVAINQASIYHWLNRDDCDNKRLSIGYWQASRIQALIGHADEARRFADVSLSYSAGLKPFYVGYAYEALARAEFLAGNAVEAAAHLKAAKALAAKVDEKDERELLLKDLATLDHPVAGVDAEVPK
jgi:hypothetical protein